MKAGKLHEVHEILTKLGIHIEVKQLGTGRQDKEIQKIIRKINAEMLHRKKVLATKIASSPFRQ